MPWPKGKPRSEETKIKIGEKSRGRIPSKETRLKRSRSMLGKNLGKPAWNKGIPITEEARKKLSQSCMGRIPGNKGKPGKKLTQKVIRNLHRKNRKNFFSSLERFIYFCMKSHGVDFKRNGYIKGFYQLAGRNHPFDFVIASKKLAVEVDGDYWHSLKNPGWNEKKEIEEVYFANLLGWRVIRISEKVLRKSPSFKRWEKQNVRS